MKLVRLNDGKLGLLVHLPTGPHVIDVGGSVGVFAHDPLSNGLLNGAFKDGGDWSTIVKNWTYLNLPLHRLATIAAAAPDNPGLVLQPYTDDLEGKRAGGMILAIDITDTDSIAKRDPTGRRVMERQFERVSADNCLQGAESATRSAQVVDFMPHIFGR